MSTSQNSSDGYRRLVLILLTIVYGFNFIDRQIVGILAPFIQKDLGLRNTELGLLIGLAFAIFYTSVAIPIAWLADRYNRVNILSIALATWSFFTALTGLASNFVQIGLARMGVGIGEAGGSSPSHSIISDYYAKEERAGALGVYSMGIPLGVMAAYFTTASLIGVGTDQVNWRRIFVILGVTGIVLAIIVRLVLREPKRGAMEMLKPEKQLENAKFSEAIKTLLTIPSWWAMCFGIAFASFAGYSFSAFQTKFVTTVDPNFDFKTLVIALGIINGTTYAAGAFLGARFSDWWGAKDIRAYCLTPALTLIIVLPLALLAWYWAPSIWIHLGLFTVMLLFMGMYLGPTFATAQTLAPINMRAMSTALFFFILNLIALGGGPSFTGWMMDFFGQNNSDVESVRKAMSVTSLLFIPAIISFLIASRLLPKDWEIAEKRNQAQSADE